MPIDFPADEAIVVKGPLLTAERIEQFRRATRTEHCSHLPPTLATLFREGEFAWLDRLGIALSSLLHADQEYLYLEPLHVGDAVTVSTHIAGRKERRGMQFLLLETKVLCGEREKIRVHTSFVIRAPSVAAP